MRHQGQAPEIDGQVYLSASTELRAGDMHKVRITQASDYDLVGDVVEDESMRPPPPARKKRVALKVLPANG